MNIYEDYFGLCFSFRQIHLHWPIRNWTRDVEHKLVCKKYSVLGWKYKRKCPWYIVVFRDIGFDEVTYYKSIDINEQAFQEQVKGTQLEEAEQGKKPGEEKWYNKVESQNRVMSWRTNED